MAPGGGFELARPDGFRLDAVKHVPTAFWAQLNTELSRAAGRELWQVGELLDGSPQATAQTWRDGGFTAMFDFPLAFAMADVFCRGAPLSQLAVVLSNDRRYPDPSQLVTLLDNHDLPRVMSVCGGRVEAVSQALGFLLSGRGIPSLTWGTEVGQTGEKEPENRASMRFEKHPLQGVISGWLALRKRHAALREGVPVTLVATADHLVIGRLTPVELALVEVERPPVERPVTGACVERPELPAPFDLKCWKLRRSEAGVSVWVSGYGDFAAATAAADRQWRTGAHTRTVHLTGPAGARVVGSAPELGDWAPKASLPLPATVQLPVGAHVAFKGLRLASDGTPTWAPGDNETLLISEGTAPLEATLRGP
jgi:hypothetical protein